MTAHGLDAGAAVGRAFRASGAGWPRGRRWRGRSGRGAGRGPARRARPGSPPAPRCAPAGPSRLNSVLVSSIGLAVPLRGAPLRPQAERADRDRSGRAERVAALGAAQDRAEAGDQLPRRAGLGHVVVGAQLEPHDAVDVVALGGQHQHRDAALRRGCGAGPRRRSGRAASRPAPRWRSAPERASLAPASPSWTAVVSNPSCWRYSRSIEASSTSSSTSSTRVIADPCAFLACVAIIARRRGRTGRICLPLHSFTRA